jgi:mannonate dehydratase
VLERSDWHARLLHGSDYPLPGIGPLYSLGALVREQLLDPALLPPLNALRARNPLLFDFALKRSLRTGGVGHGPGQGLSAAVFETRAHLGPPVSKVSPGGTA